MNIHKLSSIKVKSAKPKEKAYKLIDGGGLYLLVSKTGAKYWRYNYRFAKKYKTLAIGTYPEIGLKEAREQHIAAKELVSQGIDPSVQKQIDKNSLQENTFQSIAEMWLEKYISHLSESHKKRTGFFLNRDIYPFIGKRDVSTIEAPDIIPIIEKIANRGAIDSAKRAKGVVQQVFDFAVVHGKARRNPAKDINLQLILPRTIKKHYAAITDPAQLGELLRAIDQYYGAVQVKGALKLATMVMLRPSEMVGCSG